MISVEVLTGSASWELHRLNEWELEIPSVFPSREFPRRGNQRLAGDLGSVGHSRIVSRSLGTREKNPSSVI